MLWALSRFLILRGLSIDCGFSLSDRIRDDQYILRQRFGLLLRTGLRTGLEAVVDLRGRLLGFGAALNRGEPSISRAVCGRLRIGCHFLRPFLLSLLSTGGGGLS